MPSSRWPCATYPFPDELLSSWLVRLSHDHLCKIHTFAKVAFPGVSVWNRDVDKAAPTAVLSVLAKRTPALLDTIHQTTLKRYEGRLYEHHNPNGNTPWILPLGIYHRTRRHRGLLFCPDCLRADGSNPYFRTQWRLALALVCPKHQVLLQEQCPWCEQPIMFFRQELGRKSNLADTPISTCFHCKGDLAQSACIPAPVPLVDAQVEWYRILTEGWTTAVAYPHLYFVVLRQLAQILCSRKAACLPLQIALANLVNLDLPNVALNNVQEALSFEHLPLASRRVLLLQAHWLLTDWPNRFISFMKQHRIASTPLFQDMTEIPFWYFSVVQENLYMSNINRRFVNFWS
jgi:hypothetical protein